MLLWIYTSIYCGSKPLFNIVSINFSVACKDSQMSLPFTLLSKQEIPGGCLGECISVVWKFVDSRTNMTQIFCKFYTTRYLILCIYSIMPVTIYKWYLDKDKDYRYFSNIQYIFLQLPRKLKCIPFAGAWASRCLCCALGVFRISIKFGGAVEYNGLFQDMWCYCQVVIY